MIGANPLLATSNDRRRKLSNQLSHAAMVILAAFTLVSLVGLRWSTQWSDQVSVERQARVARHSIEVALDELALQQETVAIWDESALDLTKLPVDRQWLFDNVGSWLNRIFAQDEVFLLDGYDRPVQAVVDGKLVPSARYLQLRPDLERLVRDARGGKSGPNGAHDRNPGQALAPNSTVRTTSRATHDTHFLLVGGRPAAASAMLIKPSTENFVRPVHDWSVLIS